MAVDVRRVVRAAVEAALEDPVPEPRRRRRLSSGRAILLGAGLMTAGRLAFGSRGRELLDTVRRGIGDLEQRILTLDEDETDLGPEAEENDEALDDETDELELEDYDASDAEVEHDERPNGRDPTIRRSRGRS